MPILPTVLVNGAEGIGTGWSTYIPNYAPRDIVANLRRLLRGEPMEQMVRCAVLCCVCVCCARWRFSLLLPLLSFSR